MADKPARHVRQTRSEEHRESDKDGGEGERKGRGTDIKATQQGNYTAEPQTPSFYVFE